MEPCMAIRRLSGKWSGGAIGQVGAFSGFACRHATSKVRERWHDLCIYFARVGSPASGRLDSALPPPPAADVWSR